MSKYISTNFGNLVRRYRKRMGLTQDELAVKLGYTTRASVSRLENGLTVPNIAVLKNMANIFQCPLEEIMVSINQDEMDNNNVPQILAGTVLPLPVITEQNDYSSPGSYAFDKAVLGNEVDYGALQIMIAPNNALSKMGITKGDFVVVNIGNRVPLDGEAVVIKRDDEILLRKARYDNDKKGIEYIYDTNRYSYPTFFVGQDEKNPEIEIIGTCVSVVHRLPVTQKYVTVKNPKSSDQDASGSIND